MKNIADQLPPDIAGQIHPDRRKNEVDYWSVRDQLLAQYQGQWIGFADGKVIASGASPGRGISHGASVGTSSIRHLCRKGRSTEPNSSHGISARRRIFW